MMGNPIAHSLSPRIHRQFAEQCGQSLSYEAILVETDGFAAAVDEFQANGGKGLNITLPFKLQAFALADERSPRAERAGAVNTLVLRDDGSRYGDNTDGAGLLRDLADNHGIMLRGENILILGAGGAVRGALEPLLSAHPQRLVIANRTVSRAESLVDDFSALGPLEAVSFEALAGQGFSLIVNGTAAGVSGQVPPIPDDVLLPGGTCYDMFYASEATAFVRWGQAHGASKTLDGLGMLVEQAAESFFIWRGLRPKTHQVIESLQFVK